MAAIEVAISKGTLVIAKTDLTIATIVMIEEDSEVAEAEISDVVVAMAMTIVIATIMVLQEDHGKTGEIGMRGLMKRDLTIVVLLQEVEALLAGAKALETDKMIEATKLMMHLEIIVIEMMTTTEGLMTKET